ncbi:MAG: 2-oxo acid dehydrogenase subunit E2 [Verrucomicrobia bacterium]|nr:2-oxo acid dehydrogenase subunit E2 [Verrucomicrobiota bacterium]
MPVEFKLPELGENIETIQVVKVLVAKGDTVSIDQPLLELETGKATLELPSTVAGVIDSIHVKEGDELSVGALVLTLSSAAPEPAAAAPATAAPAPAAPATAAPAPIPEETPAPVIEPEDSETPAGAAPAEHASFAYVIPELGDGIDAIQVIKVLAGVGDTIAVDQSVLELETGKATVELPSSVAGVVETVHVREGDDVSVGQIVFTLKGEAPVAPAARKTAPAAAPAATDPVAPAAASAAPERAPTVAQPLAVTDGKRSPAAPSVRRFARELGIDIAQVPGTGPLGRISAEDVKNYSRQLNAKPRGASSTSVVASGMPTLPDLPDFEKFGAVQRDKMSVIRRKTAEQMTMSWLMVPHVTIFDQADITELDGLRKRYAPRAEELGGKLTVATMVIKIVAQALKVFPHFNASVDMVNREIIYKKYCNIGVAVDTERGLLVPVIKDTDKKSMIQIAVELTAIVERTRGGKIAMEDLEGGTFTISNLGRTAGTFFTPIINYPEVAILGIGRMTTEQTSADGATRKMLPLSLSFDHRAIDGADASPFLAWILEALNEPFLLSLES